VDTLQKCKGSPAPARSNRISDFLALGSGHDQRRDESVFHWHAGRAQCAYGCVSQDSDSTAQLALDGFSGALSAIPPELRKTLTYDKGREMHKYVQLTERTGA
jgi:IS30 family transposase